MEGLLPPRKPPGGLNCALVEILANHTDYPDVNLARDLSSCIPVVGLVPVANVSTERPRPAVASFGHWMAGIPERNASVLRRLERADGAPFARQFWDLAIREVERGRVSTPIRATSYALKSDQITPRFAISEKNVASARKVRLIDSFKASGINDSIHLAETDVPDSLYTALSMAAIHAWVRHGP